MSKVEATCSKCGKTFEADEKLIKWMDDVKGGRICSDCFAEAKKGGATKKKTESKFTGTGKSASTDGKKKLDAKALRKAYDEVVAEFADVLDDVKDFIGGWTSTIAINNSR